MRNREIGGDPGSNPGGAILKMHNSFDFEIQYLYRGTEFKFPPLDGLPNGKVILEIPESAHYISITTEELNDEAKGDKNNTVNQQVLYYDENERLLNIQNFNGVMTTSKLMKILDGAFKKLH